MPAKMHGRVLTDARTEKTAIAFYYVKIGECVRSVLSMLLLANGGRGTPP